MISNLKNLRRSESPGDSKPLAVKVAYGLCNRLRTLSSFHSLARELQRPFLLCWDESKGWSYERFSDLFDNQIDQITTVDFFEMARESLCVEKYFHTNPEESEPGFHLDLLNDRSRAITYYGHRESVSLFPRRMTLWRWPLLEHGHKSFLRSLQPVKNCQDEVNRVSTRFGSCTIGVHIRRGDALESAAADKYMVSSDDAFLKAMKEAVNKSPDANFFLSTDCSTTQERFLSYFGDRVIVNDRKTFVASNLQEHKDNQFDAVIDLWLLSKTVRIIGNNWSSFSTTAAIIGEIPISIAKA
ncbi:MAG: hypothetical protein K2X93_15830 [Candidatus Obscuribacterales bacterium]|nr:hypothetical protein [Candidatus Obscuribacterales bacterium]